MNDYTSDEEFENIYDDFDNDSSLNLSMKKKGKFYVNLMYYWIIFRVCI